jgi:hypothetical protein
MRALPALFLFFFALLASPAGRAATVQPESDVLPITGPDGVTPLTEIHGNQTSGAMLVNDREVGIQFTVAESLGLLSEQASGIALNKPGTQNISDFLDVSRRSCGGGE